MIATAVEAELASYLAQFADLRTEAGHAAVVRNGHHPERPFQTGIGPVSVRISKVRSKDGQPVTFRSALVPPSSFSVNEANGEFSKNHQKGCYTEVSRCL